VNLAPQQNEDGMSRTGLLLCATYAALIAGCVSYALLGGLDDKSRFVFLQIPIVLQSAVVDMLGFSAILQNVTWVTAYLIFAAPVFMLLYALGLIRDSIRITAHKARDKP
jgi:arginine exporter protein ArgO